MSKFRLALVRQKYRPDGGAERFVSRALEALDASDLELNVITREWQGPVKPEWNIHICNPRKWGRISRERGFADAARQLWQREAFDLVVLETLERWVQTTGTGLRQPYLTLWFDVPPATAAARLAGARQPDKFEAEPLAFFERVAAGYARRAAGSPERVVRIDAVQDVAGVWAQVEAVCRQRGMW